LTISLPQFTQRARNEYTAPARYGAFLGHAPSRRCSGRRTGRARPPLQGRDRARNSCDARTIEKKLIELIVTGTMRDLPHLLREAELELAEADGTLYANIGR
jgi:hypothetical protein